jgi:predicted lipid-binding transport protein (Tim44 family)
MPDTSSRGRQGLPLWALAVFAAVGIAIGLAIVAIALRSRRGPDETAARPTIAPARAPQPSVTEPTRDPPRPVERMAAPDSAAPAPAAAAAEPKKKERPKRRRVRYNADGIPLIE